MRKKFVYEKVSPEVRKTIGKIFHLVFDCKMSFREALKMEYHTVSGMLTKKELLKLIYEAMEEVKDF